MTTRCRITITASSRRGGRAVVSIDGLHSGYEVTIAKVRGVTEVTTRLTGTLRLGPLGEWLSDTVQHVVTTGCGVLEYDLKIADGEVRAVQVATQKGRAA